MPEKRHDVEAGRVLDGCMNACVVMTVLAPDRTGIVRSLSETVAEHGGNWLESRMARMAGQFAGILRVECDESRVDEMIAALQAMKTDGVSVQVEREFSEESSSGVQLSLDVVGNDCPGIVRALSAAIAGVGANVEELHTALESAPMSGHPLFHAQGIVALPGGVSADALTTAIESLGEDLAVTIESGQA